MNEQAIAGCHRQHQGCLHRFTGALGALAESEAAFLVQLHDSQLDGFVATSDAAVLRLTLKGR